MPSPSSIHIRKGLLLIAAPLLAVALVAPLVSGQVQQAPRQVASSEELIHFLPEPDGLFVQRTSSFPQLGDTRLTAVLSTDAVQELQKVTGRSDFAVIGSRDAQVILRDDGQGGDVTAGDRRFSAIISLPVAEAQDRDSEETDALNKTGASELVFEGRTITTTRSPSRGFDATSFLAGQEVALEPAAAVVEGESAPSQTTTSLRIGTPPKGATIDQAAVLGTNAFQEKVLMIRDVSVVTDPTRTYDPCTNTGNPDGAWAFKHLVTEMANQSASGITPEALVSDWLNNWLSSPSINGDSVPARTQMSHIINNWLDNGQLDLDEAPLRLLAIVNRIDLARTTGSTSSYGGASTGDFVDAGELRFVFGFVVRPGDNENQFITPVPIGNPANDCHALPFTVIFEYGVPKCDCPGVRDWARRWRELADLTLGSSTYRARLERLTRQITRAGADPTKPNGNALNQLRTNEVALAAPWQLREFQLTQAPFSFLEETTVNDTPRDSTPAGFNGTGTFDAWVNQVRAALIAAGSFEGSIPAVPLLFPVNSFQAAHANVPEGNPSIITFHWDTTNLFDLDINTNPFGNWARHRASRAACNGCHRRETNTDFVHVDPTDLNKAVPGDASLPAQLSPFLTGINNLPDPAAPGNLPQRDFDDLARREMDLKRKARMVCCSSVVICRHCVLDSLATSNVLPVDLTGGKGAVADRLSLGCDVPLLPRIHEVH